MKNKKTRTIVCNIIIIILVVGIVGIVLNMFSSIFNRTDSTRTETNEILWVKYGTKTSSTSGGFFTSGEINENPCYYVNLVENGTEHIKDFSSSIVKISKELNEDETPYMVRKFKNQSTKIASEVEIHLRVNSEVEKY